MRQPAVPSLARDRPAPAGSAPSGVHRRHRGGAPAHPLARHRQAGLPRTAAVRPCSDAASTSGVTRPRAKPTRTRETARPRATMLNEGWSGDRCQLCDDAQRCSDRWLRSTSSRMPRWSLKCMLPAAGRTAWSLPAAESLSAHQYSALILNLFDVVSCCSIAWHIRLHHNAMASCIISYHVVTCNTTLYAVSLVTMLSHRLDRP